MYSKILFLKKIPIKKKVKNLLEYINRVRGAKKSWKKRHSKLLSINKEYGKPCSHETEIKHKKLWSDFRSRVDKETLRISCNLSNIEDYRMVPEDIYTADIEPSLTDDPSVNFLSNKSFYNQWFPKGIFPEDIYHKIRGEYYNSNLLKSDSDEFEKKSESIEYPVILKPNWDTYGGADINFVENKEMLLEVATSYDDFVVQKIIKQHSFFNKYNSYGLNTIKVFLYKSVRNNRWHILSMALRLGKDGSLDNETAGGINTFIEADGIMNDYAVDKYGNKYFEHPNSGIKFSQKIPNYQNLADLSHLIADRVFFTRIIGLDACYDSDGNWRIIEVNTLAQSIRFSQYGGKPFFGEFTEEVIEYCKNDHWTFNQ